jgi:ethanolaminephosphotransferase
MGYISQQGLDNLKYYRYSGVDKSFLANLFLKKHWDWCTRVLFPIWMAPNLITLLGLISVTINCALILYYCPQVYLCECPSWVYVVGAIGVYMYQIFDNVDGRQARRTGTSSPLGELFDHGCDSLFVPIAGMLIFNCMHFDAWGVWMAFWSTGIPFFMAHWEEYHTGELVLGVVGNPTEGQLVMCTFLLLTATYGPTYWDRSFNDMIGLGHLSGLPVVHFNQFMLSLVLFGGLLLTLYNTAAVLRQMSKSKSEEISSGSGNNNNHNNNNNNNVPLSMGRVLTPVQSLLLLFPMFAAGSLTTAWFYVSPTNLLATHTALAIFFMGFQFSYILNRMLIARITRTDYNVWNPIFALPAAGFLYALFPNAREHEVMVFYVLFGLLVVVYVHFCYSVITTLASHLKINVLTIKSPKLQ